MAAARQTWKKGLPTAAILIALVGIGVAAVVDAARSDGDGARATADAAPTPPQAREELVATLEAEGLAGVLYYSNPEDECRLAAVALPSLRAVPPPKLRACRFELAPDPEPSATLAGVTWRPDGLAAARCRAGYVEVLAADGRQIGDFEGCAPAWKPNRRLTFVRAGEIVEARVPCVDAAVCERVVFSQAELRQAFRGDPSVEWLLRQGPATLLFHEVAWFSETRLAASVEFTRGNSLPIVFEKKQPLDPVAGQTFRKLELGPMSPERIEMMLDTGSGDPWRLRRDGGLSFEWLPPSISNVSAVTWSPDERWQAVATRASIYVFERNKEQPRLIRLPIAAADISWR